MKYALTVPFMELLFHLAYSSGQERPAGWVGQITSNSFMKREFGSKLIEQFLPTVDLRTVIDTSGAYIPGHGTPTAIIIGRNQFPSTETLRTVLGIRSEPGKPAEPSKGLVWSAIVEHLGEPGYEDSLVTVADLPRSGFRTHPWSLSGGGAVDLLKLINASATGRLVDRTRRMGVFGMTNADEVMLSDKLSFERKKVEADLIIPLTLGDEVRDWVITGKTYALFPYSDRPEYKLTEPSGAAYRWLWPSKTILGNRATFSKMTYFEEGRPWYEWHQLTRDPDASVMSITFAEIATHNHFVLDVEGRAFKHSAPVIKLPTAAKYDDHLRLLGVLNSSVACFWLKQNCFDKGRPGAELAGADEPWEHRYVFNSTSLQDFPLPPTTLLEHAQLLNDLSHQQRDQTPSCIANSQTPTLSGLEAARSQHDRIRALMIAHQEEMDWAYYRTYGLIEDDLTYSGDLPGIASAERVFAIALARQLTEGIADSSWFTHHNHKFKPVTEIPDHLPSSYREIMQRRLDALESNPSVRLLERPEYKRRWAMEPWDKQVDTALRGWLLDRVEGRTLWFDRDGRPTLRSVAQLADILDRDADFRDVLRLWAGDPNAATGTALAKLLADQAVPFLAAYRYKPSGLDKRADWEHTWSMQRREDAEEKLDSPIPVPPKYKPTDFARPSYWSHRGKLDVPKERFISYPNAGRDTDVTELLGWAGWDHADQALALAALVSARIDEGWETSRLIPLLAGLHELAPWVRQWHHQIDPEFGESVADTIDGELTERLTEHHLTTTDLTTWRPAPTTRGRRARTS